MSAHGRGVLYRRNVGVAVFNNRGEVLAAERADRPGAWQLPQGGLDGGEDPWAGAMRELKEEIGTSNVAYLGEIDKWLRYEFPDPYRPFKTDYIGQEQKWFAARFLGMDSDIDLNTSAPAEFSRWRWQNLEDIAGQIVEFKRGVYAEVARKFSRFAKPHE